MTAQEKKGTAKEFEIIQHALGLHRSKTSYRNYYCISPECDDFPLPQDMAARGLLCSHAPTEGVFPLAVFHVTQAGRDYLTNQGET